MPSEGRPADVVATATVTGAFLPRARVLAASLRRAHPEIPFVLLLLDDPGGKVRAREPFEVLLPADLPGPDLPAVLFRYTEREAGASAKPQVLRHLLGRGHRRVLFLDADMVITAGLHPVLDALDEASILFTPHLLAPATGPDARERELLLVRAGVLNTGLVGVRAGAEAERFLDWWTARTLTHGVADLDNGVHMDQRWADLAPGMFSGVRLLRDPGVNVAYWNLAERPLREEGGVLTAAGRPCRIIHASGYDVRRPDVVSAYAPDLRPDPLVSALLERYRRALLDAGEAEALGAPWAYDRWADGAPIPDDAREAHRRLGADARRFGDPFAVGPGSFRDALTAA